jgi:tetratricopeptide (TPR) repeat protein
MLESSETINSKVEFDSSNIKLNEGFYWAKSQALKYVFTGDTVGDWYEASLPSRYAFCMRDVAHQSTGAQVLGLYKFNKNMLEKFAQNISEKRDWCSYWEINKFDSPAPVDYKSDEDFWYNLPANFDILDCCYRQYQWTGDRDYINSDVFLNFYERTVEDYIKAWDINNDGIMEHKGPVNYRGIASYMEDCVGTIDNFVGHDMICAQYAGFMAYATILKLNGDVQKSKIYEEKAENLKDMFNSKWWSDDRQSYYGFTCLDGEFYIPKGCDDDFNTASSMPLYFGIAEGSHKIKKALKSVISCKGTNVESMSYFPEILYRYGCSDEAYKYLMKLIDPALKRREYPEVSYAVIGSIATGMMGIKPDAKNRLVETTGRLTCDVDWTEIKNLPVLGNEITVKHKGVYETSFINITGTPITWRAMFKGKVDTILVNDTEVKAKWETKQDGQTYSYSGVEVDTNERYTAKINI